MLLTPAYPEVAPRCTIRPAGTSIDSQNFDQALKDIEVEVNAYYDEIVTDDPESWDWVLSHQLRRLQVFYRLCKALHLKIRKINNNVHILLFNDRLALTRLVKRVKRVVEVGLYVDGIDGSRWHLVLLLRLFSIADGRILVNFVPACL